MPSIFKTRNGWRAMVRIKGTKSVNASFPTEQEATDWAVKEETKKKPKSTAYTCLLYTSDAADE